MKNFLYGVWLTVLSCLFVIVVPFIIGGLGWGVYYLAHGAPWSVVVLFIAIVLATFGFVGWLINFVATSASDVKAAGIQTSPSLWVWMMILSSVVGIALSLIPGAFVFSAAGLALYLLKWLLIFNGFTLSAFMIYGKIVWADQLDRGSRGGGGY